MATKTAPTPTPPDDGLEAAYLQARADLDDAKRQPHGHEPVIEDVEEDRGDHIAVFRRTHRAPIDAAQANVKATEGDLRRAHGQVAVDVADAKARHHTATTELQIAERAGLSTTTAELARLIGAEEAAARHVAIVERHAARRAEIYEQRCALDAQHADVLDAANQDLETARQQLADKATAAERALLDLVAAADAYKDAQAAVGTRLGALGFTDGQQHDGTPHTTTSGPVLRVASRDWIRVDVVELLPRTVLRVAQAIGEIPLRDRLFGLAGVRQYAADALLGATPLEHVDRHRPAPASVMALRDWFGPVEVVKARPGGYYKDPQPKKRRINFSRKDKAA